MANTNRLSIGECCSRTETVLRTRHYSRSTTTSYESRKKGLGFEFLSEVERTIASILAAPAIRPDDFAKHPPPHCPSFSFRCSVMLSIQTRS
jgi:hypothetical protein